MARKISLINYKGGVGKTSVIVNLASCLAYLGKRVLLVDFDAQSNTSIWLMRLERWNALNNNPEGSLFSIFDPGTQTLKDCIQKDVVEDKNGNKVLPRLDLIPTTFQLIDLEHEFRTAPGRPPYVIFQEQIAEIEDRYDFILFDCPPNVLRASQCALFCSDEVYVPSNPDALSLIGFTLFVNKLMQFQEVAASFRKSGMNRPAEVQGIIFNSIKANVDIEVPKMRMQFRMNQFRNQKRVARTSKIFTTMIRDAIIVRRAVSLGLPVLLVGQQPNNEGVIDDYFSLAEELMAHGQAGQASSPATMPLQQDHPQRDSSPSSEPRGIFPKNFLS